jgi:hypothetical protein
MFTAAGYEPVALTAGSVRGATITMKANQRYANMGSVSQGLLVMVDGQASDLSLEEATKKLGKDFGKSVYLDPAAAKTNTEIRGKGAIEVTSRSKAKESGIILPIPGRMKQISPPSGARVSSLLPTGLLNGQISG